MFLVQVSSHLLLVLVWLYEGSVSLPWSCFSTLFSSSRIEEISCRKKGKKNNTINNNTALSFESNIAQTDGSLYLVGGFQEWYVTLRTQFILNFIPVPVLILKQYPGEKQHARGHMFIHSGFGNTMAHRGIHSQKVIISQSTITWFFLLFCRQSFWSWWTAEKLNGAAGCPTLPEYTEEKEKKLNLTYGNQKVPPCRHIFDVMLSVLLLTSSRFQVRLLRARGSRLSGARGRSSTGLPLISGALLVEITGGIFLKLRLSSNTRSTNWPKTGRDVEQANKIQKPEELSVQCYFSFV